MERKHVVLGLALVVALATGVAAQDKKKKADADPTGPYGLPTLDAVKKKVQPTEDEAKKIEEVYAAAAKNEAESKARAKENGTDRKTLEGYLSIGRGETINKVKEALDRDKSKLFDELVAGGGKKKK